MKIAPRETEGFLRTPSGDVVAVLIYGPDQGLAAERAKQLTQTIVPDADDPFAVTTLSAATVKGDPARLADEAGALSLTGGGRVVRISDGADGIAPAFESFLSDAILGGALVIVEAGALGPRSSLRKLFEAAPNAATIACYEDDARALAGVIRDTLSRTGLSVTRDALDYLANRLGGDRMQSRGELEKLALYMGAGATDVTLADAEAVVGDSAAVSIDDAVFAAASGNFQRLEAALGRALNEGVQPVQIVRAAERHFQRLHLAQAHVARGKTPVDALKSLTPRPIYKVEDELLAQLRHWPLSQLATALEALTEAELELKSTGLPAASVLGRALMRLAGQARRAA